MDGVLLGSAQRERIAADIHHQGCPVGRVKGAGQAEVQNPGVTACRSDKQPLDRVALEGLVRQHARLRGEVVAVAEDRRIHTVCHHRPDRHHPAPQVAGVQRAGLGLRRGRQGERAGEREQRRGSQCRPRAPRDTRAREIRRLAGGGLCL